MQTEPVNDLTPIQEVINLLDVIIWPITLIVALILFKRNLASIIQRLGSFEAGATGISLSFQNKIEATKQLLLPGANGTQSKSATSINARENTPFHQLLDIREALNGQMIHKAQLNDIPTGDTSSLELNEKLKEIGGITLKNAQVFEALMDLTGSGDTTISQSQVDEVKNLYDTIQL